MKNWSAPLLSIPFFLATSLAPAFDLSEKAKVAESQLHQAQKSGSLREDQAADARKIVSSICQNGSEPEFIRYWSNLSNETQQKIRENTDLSSILVRCAIARTVPSEHEAGTAWPLRMLIRARVLHEGTAKRILKYDEFYDDRCGAIGTLNAAVLTTIYPTLSESFSTAASEYITYRNKRLYRGEVLLKTSGKKGPTGDPTYDRFFGETVPSCESVQALIKEGLQSAYLSGDDKKLDATKIKNFKVRVASEVSDFIKSHVDSKASETNTSAKATEKSHGKR